jgi:MoCo/4Fe-4S cofactor protein with predicted Tat translocation signal
MQDASTMDVAENRANGTRHWRSFDDLQNSPEFQEMVAREFPEGVVEGDEEQGGAVDDVSRRGFLSAVAASVAFAGLTSCRKPKTKILPFNKRPEGFTPGIPQTYATTLTRGGYGLGVLVRSSDGRPTKIEGNPNHPSTMGASDARLQAELLQIYDPGRSHGARGPHSDGAHDHAADDHGHDDHGHGGHAHDPNEIYEQFFAFWEERSKSLRLANKGAGLHILMPRTTSPSLLAMVANVKDTFAEARVYQWDAIHDDSAMGGSKFAFGKYIDQHVDYEKAKVVASFDCDFLALDGNTLANSRKWGRSRRAPAPGGEISRLYVFESCFSTTGTAADHRFPMTAADVYKGLLALAAEVGVGGDLAQEVAKHKSDAAWVKALAQDLRSASGDLAVVAGPRLPAAAHAVAHAINQTLGSKSVVYTARPESMQTGCVESIAALKTAIDAGQVNTLICLGTNPVYDAPSELDFAAALEKVRSASGSVIHLGLHVDETGAHADWHLPLAHELETWGDARAHDGTISLQQPMLEPLFGGMSALEFLAWVSEQTNHEMLQTQRDGSYGHQLVQDYWRDNGGAVDFASWWARSLHDGQLQDTAYAKEAVTLDPAGVALAVQATPMTEGFEIHLRPCPKMWDGRYGNNSWMQELPDPLTKLTWDNAALLSKKTADRLGVTNGDMVTLAAGNAALQAAAWILPGHADECATVYLGWGRQLPEDCKVAKGTGFNGYGLRTSGGQWVIGNANANRSDGRYLLVCTQEHGTMAGRDIVREATKSEYAAQPEWAPMKSPLDQAARLLKKQREQDVNKSLWTERYEEGRNDPEVAASPYQWGMVIDLNACTGCSACVVACVAENNIPMVGKTQVARNREMFWIRADRYFTSDDTDDLQVAAENPSVHNMPVPCMQCENAPCESVCPVAATMHSPDGLNDMVYNRCIGTRYCSNNCPYKVRRYNYLDYIGHAPETKRMAFNPDVTVRSRGVMEKCTYCVQRINGGRISAKLSGTKVGDNEGQVKVQTACAQACPTEAITFGNIIDTTSSVAKLRQSPLNYGLLSEMNTKPRTTYLGRVRNPNPALEGGRG